MLRHFRLLKVGLRGNIRNRKPAYVCLAGGVFYVQHFALCSCVPCCQLRLWSNTTKWFMIPNESIFDQKGPKALLHKHLLSQLSAATAKRFEKFLLTVKKLCWVQNRWGVYSKMKKKGQLGLLGNSDLAEFHSSRWKIPEKCEP